MFVSIIFAAMFQYLSYIIKKQHEDPVCPTWENIQVS